MRITSSHEAVAGGLTIENRAPDSDIIELSRQSLRLRLALSHGAYIFSHIHVERHSSSALNQLCQAGSTFTNEWTFV